MLTFLFVVFGWVAAAVAGVIVAAWALGLVVSDRWGWSQWLAWMPSVAALSAAVLGFVAAWRPARPGARRRRMFIWCAIVILTGTYLAFIENRLLRSAPAVPHNALSIVHWNASPAGGTDRTDAIELVLDLEADITILTDAHLITWHAHALDRLGDDAHLAASFPFAFISRHPIREVQPLVAVDDIYAVTVRIDASATSIGRELLILAIDLPSDLSLSRMELAQRLRDLLIEAGSPHERADVTLGDFNITRGSASLSLLAPNRRHAWNEAGRGWSATFPRERALLHIDHTFINPQTLRAVDYEIINLPAARHRAQRVAIERRYD